MADEKFEQGQTLPLEQRLDYDHWKVRANAYEELAKKQAEALSSDAKIFSLTSRFVPAVSHLSRFKALNNSSRQKSSCKRKRPQGSDPIL